MCGIAGIIDSSLSSEQIPNLLKSMTDIIAHRGPDDEGFFVADGVGLGMRRLSIIDLNTGDQPIYNEDKSVVVVFNGEIYNYKILRAELEKRGHIFKTSSDTEVLVHSYEEYGEDFPTHLRGMFAFAIWDKNKNKLFIARDRLGIKPLYYTLVGDKLIFASEIKSILEHPEVTPRMDLLGFSDYISLRYVPAPKTMFQDIVALEPAHTLTYDENGLSTRQYWDVSFSPDNYLNCSEEECAEQLKELITQSVEMRLMSDVPFGAFLSGGIDSSTVVALMSGFLNEPVKTFSVGYGEEGEAFSELPYARMVADKYQTDHHEVILTSKHFIELSEKVAWHLDQPISDYVVLANYMVAQLATQKVKMVLTGEGGDELFAGYARYAGERFSPYARWVPQPAMSLAVAASSRIPGIRRQKQAIYAMSFKDEAARLTNWFPLFNQEWKDALLTDSIKTSLDGYSSNNVFGAFLDHTDAVDPVSRMQYVETKFWLPDNLLARGDKLSMANSLEARVPLLDSKLVEFAASLPPGMKIKGMTRKYLLKKVAGEWLPDEIIHRTKKGFPVPIPVWFRNQVRSYLHDHLSPDTIRRRGLFNPDYVEKLLTEHDSGFADHARPLFGLLSVELWQRQYFD
ncbi:MAG: asparagine synthase (glutamine-hydrolyzing) [Anaerolineae bacterium]|nr:asparagine synthase (glutamine-hydrolyzing) [Anaerolineae bacterium]